MIKQRLIFYFFFLEISRAFKLKERYRSGLLSIFQVFSLFLFLFLDLIPVHRESTTICNLSASILAIDLGVG